MPGALPPRIEIGACVPWPGCCGCHWRGGAGHAVAGAVVHQPADLLTRVFNGANLMLDATRGKPGAGWRERRRRWSRCAAAAAARRDALRPRSRESLAPHRLPATAARRATRSRRASATSRSSRYSVARKDGFPPTTSPRFTSTTWSRVPHLARPAGPADRSRPRTCGCARDGFERIELAARERQQQVAMSKSRRSTGSSYGFGTSPEIQRMSDAEKQEAGGDAGDPLRHPAVRPTVAIDTGDDAPQRGVRRVSTRLEKMLGRPVERIRSWLCAARALSRALSRAPESNPELAPAPRPRRRSRCAATTARKRRQQRSISADRSPRRRPWSSAERGHARHAPARAEAVVRDHVGRHASCGICASSPRRARVKQRPARHRQEWLPIMHRARRCAAEPAGTAADDRHRASYGEQPASAVRPLAAHHRAMPSSVRHTDAQVATERDPAEET